MRGARAACCHTTHLVSCAGPVLSCTATSAHMITCMVPNTKTSSLATCALFMRRARVVPSAVVRSSRLNEHACAQAPHARLPTCVFLLFRNCYCVVIIAGLQQDPPEGVNASPRPENIMQWKAVIFGPEGTVWEGGIFCLTMEFSEDYPNKAPLVKFVTRMFHPNVYNHGGICLDILQNQWSPIYDVSAVLTSIQSLLSDPNANSPANSDAARLFSEDRKEYNRRVLEVIQDSWRDDGRDLDVD